LHGIVLTVWFLLATVQPYLVASNRTRVHKRIGKAGYVIAITLVALSVLTVAMRDAPTIDEFPIRGGPNLYSLAMFLSCAIMGLRLRNKPNVHKRLMLMASIPLLAPAMDRMARIPALNDFLSGILFWFPDSPQIAFATLGFLALIISVVVYDLFTERKVHRGTLLGLGGMFVLAPAVTAALTLSGAWAAFVRLFA